MLVSVCIPTYNRPTELARVVDEVLAQSYHPIEVIITDDGLSAETAEALGERLESVRYYANEQRLGIYGNWNRSISMARGDLVAVYHDHDFYDRGIVEQSVDLFNRHPSLGIVHVATSAKLPDGAIQQPHSDLPEFASGKWYARRQAWRWHSYVAHGSMMVRRRLYEQLGVFREDLGIAADMELLIRFCMHADIGYVREPLYFYVGRHPGDALYGFKWSNILEYARVRRINLRHVYGASQAYRRALIRFQAQLDQRILVELAAARVHGRDDVLGTCDETVLREVSAPARWAAEHLLRRSPIADVVLSFIHGRYRGWGSYLK